MPREDGPTLLSREAHVDGGLHARIYADQNRTDRLVFNFGCKDPENGPMAQVLSGAPDILPVGKFIEDRRLEDGAWDRHQFTDQ